MVYCGDGVLQPNEPCDEGSSNGQAGVNCSTTCQRQFVPTCGDGHIDYGEECDDGNLRNGDACNAQCKLEQGSCGDTIVQSARGEECDKGIDFNGHEGIDCSAECKWLRLPQCGDGVIDVNTELCDNGADNGNYSETQCLSNCMLPYCSDRIIEVNEQCDDGNLFDGDGCDHTCIVENPSAPPTVIGQLIPGGGNIPRNIPTPARTPTGPGLVIFLASGAAAGFGLVRRRYKK